MIRLDDNPAGMKPLRRLLLVCVLLQSVLASLAIHARTAHAEVPILETNAPGGDYGLFEDGQYADEPVSLPLIRPSLAAGVSLAIMEVLADFAVVRYFNTATLSEGVVHLWVGQMDRDAAVQLASLLLLIAPLVILIEHFLRLQARYYQIGSQARPFTRTRLRGWRAALATAERRG